MPAMQAFFIEGFEILKKLGQGGMAEVWKARQISLDRIVALKILPQHLAHDPAEIERFRFEAQATAKLKHPGIVQVYDAGEYEGICYFVMEYVAGYSVADRVQREGALSQEHALSIAEDTAIALDYALNEAGIIHCDIKPENILIDEDGTVKLADLGLARIIGSIIKEQDTELIVGTPSYMSPEQASGEEELDFHTDIYSLGATLYHMVTGKIPFGEMTDTQVIEHQISGELNDPKQLNPNISSNTAWLIEKMMAKFPGDRQKNWSDVLRDIRSVKAGYRPASDFLAAGRSTVSRSEQRKRAPSSPKKAEIRTADLAKYRLKTAKSKSHKSPITSIAVTALIMAGIIGGVYYFLLRQTPRNELPPIVQTKTITEKRQPDRIISCKPEEFVKSGTILAEAVTESEDIAGTPKEKEIEEPTPALSANEKTLDVLMNSSGKPHEILWQAGKLNGLPRDGFQELIAGEYGMRFTEGESVHIRKPEDLVQVLSSQQAFIIHVCKITPADAILKIAVNSSQNQASEITSQPCDYDARRLQIWWEDERVWRRWIPPGHYTIEIYICREWIDLDENLLTIQNEGTDPLCIDAIWMEPLQPGPTMFSALEGGNILSRDAAEFVPVCAIKLPSPQSDAISTNSHIRESLQQLAKRNPPRTTMEAVKEWNTLKEPVGAENILDDSLKEVDKAWQEAIADALRRGMFPLVEIDAHGSDCSWLLWAQRYGPFVGHWLLKGARPDIERISALIHERIPDAEITWAASYDDLANDTVIRGVKSLMVERMCGYWGRRTDTTPGCWRLKSWAGKSFAYEPFDHWLNLWAPYQPWSDIVIQRKHAGMISEAIVQWWMAGGNKLVIQSGKGESIFFPDGTDRPSVSWDAVRLLCQMGNGSAQRSVCNVDPEDRKRALADTYWAASSDNTNSVNIAFFAGNFDRDRTVNVTVPVPWSGPTKCSIDSVLLHGRDADPEILKHQELNVKAIRPQKDWRIPQPKRDNGYIEFSFPLASVHLVRLSPDTVKSAIRQFFMNKSSKLSEPLYVKGMFEPQDKPLQNDLRITEVRNANGLADRLSNNCEHQTIEATPGSLSAWCLKNTYIPQQIEIPNVVPWDSKSDLIIMNPLTANNARPEAIRLYWNTSKIEKADRVAFWARARKKSGENEKMTSKREFPSFLIGTQYKRERLTLRPDCWQMFTVKPDLFRDNNGRLPSYLTIWRDTGTKASQEIEFNGFLALSTSTEDCKPVSEVKGHMSISKDGSEMLLALIGQEGKPGYWHCRMPNPIEIDSAKVEKTQNEASDESAPKLGCKFRYHEKAQILEVEVNAFPPVSLNPPPSLIREFFPGLSFAINESNSSVLLIRCRIRQ